MVAVPSAPGERLPRGSCRAQVCAGLTTYKALTQIGARPGALVAVQGIGGLGHLALQYAGRLGYRVAAVARGTGKAELAAENEDNLAFSVQQGIRPMNEVLPLADAPKAYERMMAGDARFRMVLDLTA